MLGDSGFNKEQFNKSWCLLLFISKSWWLPQFFFFVCASSSFPAAQGFTFSNFEESSQWDTVSWQINSRCSNVFFDSCLIFSIMCHFHKLELCYSMQHRFLYFLWGFQSWVWCNKSVILCSAVGGLGTVTLLRAASKQFETCQCLDALMSHWRYFHYYRQVT